MIKVQLVIKIVSLSVTISKQEQLIVNSTIYIIKHSLNDILSLNSVLSLEVASMPIWRRPYLSKYAQEISIILNNFVKIGFPSKLHDSI